MLVVRVELWSAVTGKKTELARMDISNIGGTRERGDYRGRVYRGRNADDLDHSMRKQVLTREGLVKDYPRLSKHVWNLVARMLTNAGYK